MDYCIRFINMPCAIKGFSVIDDDGFYNIYINAKLSCEQQREAIQHEITHFVRDDFNSVECIEVIENIVSM